MFVHGTICTKLGGGVLHMHVRVCYLCLQMMVCTWRMLLTETSTSCVRVEGYGLEHIKPFTFGLGSLSRWAI